MGAIGSAITDGIGKKSNGRKGLIGAIAGRAKTKVKEERKETISDEDSQAKRKGPVTNSLSDIESQRARRNKKLSSSTGRGRLLGR